MKTKEVLNRVVAWTAVGVTFVGFGAASLVNRDFGYGAEFLSNSIIWVNDSEYYPGSKYVSDFMQTKTYSNLRKDITAEVYKGNTSSQWSLSFNDTMTMLTLWKYNYTSVATQSDNLYKITTTITDVYDFNKEKDNGTWLNDYLNVMHSANEYWMLTPYTTKIVIEDTIPLK